MKKLIFLFAFLGLLISQTASAQVFSEKGKFIATAGLKLGFYKNDITLYAFGADSTGTDTTGAFYYPISLEYCITNRISAGITYRAGRYFEDDDQSNNKVGAFDMHATFHFMKKERNDLYARFQIGFGNLNIKNIDDIASSEGNWSFGSAGLSIGYQHTFGEHVGFYLNLGRANYNLTQKDLYFNGERVDTADIKWDMKLRGTEFSFGLLGRF